MNSAELESFRQVWLVDFEFHQPDGCRPEPICVVGRELRAGRTIRVWADELARMTRPPFSIGPEAVFVAYYASAELGCSLALGWPAPVRILDLFAEFRCLTNGLSVPCGNGLLGALAYYGLDAMAAAEKDSMRDLAIRGGPYTNSERDSLLAYCEGDVVALARLLPAMLPEIDMPRALLRGRYMAAAAQMESTGAPIDTDTLGRLRENWTTIKGRLVDEVDRDYGVYVPTGQTINPQSTFGTEILRTARDWGIDPYMLAEAADTVWREEKHAHAEHQEALKAARKTTGLTAGRISDWEHAGRDHSTWPGLDVKARELAGEYPALGIGTGFEETGYDDADYAGQLWQLLREGAPAPKPRHDPTVLGRAAELIASAGPDCRADRLSFSTARWAEWLSQNEIPWPRLESGALNLSDDTFRQMARQHTKVAPIRELRHTLSQLRLNDLAVGPDGRNRCLLSAFRAKTGRNQPSNSRFIFGPSCWLRGLIRPSPGQAVAYVDWEQQEFGIAAALSGDGAMMEAYASGDPYLTFAKQARAVPPEATRATHPQKREQFKVTSLAVQYGMGARSLAQSLGICEAQGRELLRLHRQTYPRFWRWSEAAVNHAMLHGRLHTVFGWQIRVGPESNPRSLSNFPVQGNGAEMLRLACCLATERGISVCAPVHDALLVEGMISTTEDMEISTTTTTGNMVIDGIEVVTADAEKIMVAGAEKEVIDDIKNVVAVTQAAMAEASRIVLAGFELRTDAKIVRWPDHYMDDRGAMMWQTVMAILAEMESSPSEEEVSKTWTPTCPSSGTPALSYL